MRWPRRRQAWLLLILCGALAALDSAQTLPLIHKKRYAMGAVFEIAAYDSSPERASAAMDKALDEVVRLDNMLSNFKPESDLSRMNRAAHFHSVKVPPDLYRVMEQALLYSRVSGGMFDVSVAPVVDLWKAAMDGGPAPTAEQLEKARECVGYRKIELNPPDRIVFHSGCMRIDLGAIGKGYAVDRAAEILRASGISRAMIDAGGSTFYAIGNPPEQKSWTVRLRDPSGHLDPSVALRDNSVSTSEQTAVSELHGEAPGHIVVPRSGEPLRTGYAVSVVAKSATASDALSTMLLLLGPEQGKAALRRMPDAAAIWVRADGRKVVAGAGPQIFWGSVNPSTAAEGVAENVPARVKRD